ncbi:hypothetical protein [Kitasatospora atroaurantiaca]|uniref:Uncharacterized protein n=1 Tax=Kitasatospora atroaurantiaca TaxID=285545 RepID=A0A561ENI8_9ACTN|nr:hypothetical protein [Kitasatospora atroaurantiaca]TWE17174.1 hypothetical protein FB465_2181 [Kitasatospora atroaurantiaca]
MSLVPIERFLYEIRPAKDLPPGKAYHLIEREGELIGWFAEGHLSELCCEQLNAFHAEFFNQMMWLQNWDPEIDRLRPPDDLPTGVAEARYVFVTEEAMPRGRTCNPVEAEREFIWQIRDGEMSEQARQELNAYLEILIGRGLFVQQKP